MEVVISGVVVVIMGVVEVVASGVVLIMGVLLI